MTRQELRKKYWAHPHWHKKDIINDFGSRAEEIFKKAFESHQAEGKKINKKDKKLLEYLFWKVKTSQWESIHYIPRFEVDKSRQIEFVKAMHNIRKEFLNTEDLEFRMSKGQSYVEQNKKDLLPSTDIKTFALFLKQHFLLTISLQTIEKYLNRK